MSQTISVINRSGACFFFTRIKLVVHVLAYARVIASDREDWTYFSYKWICISSQNYGIL